MTGQRYSATTSMVPTMLAFSSVKSSAGIQYSKMASRCRANTWRRRQPLPGPGDAAHTGLMADMTPDAKASWRRFWRNGPPTPRQTADEALARLLAAEELAETPADLRNLADPYDAYLAEQATDPLTTHLDKARRVHRGRATRRMKRRLSANKNRQRH